MSAVVAAAAVGVAVGSGLVLAGAVDALTGSREPVEGDGWTVVCRRWADWRVYPRGELDQTSPRCLTRAGAVRWAGREMSPPVCGDDPCGHVPPHVTLAEDRRVNPQDYVL